MTIARRKVRQLHLRCFRLNEPYGDDTTMLFTSSLFFSMILFPLRVVIILAFIVISSTR